MKNERNDILVVGAALFAMFFGAGNLIFPPTIGLSTGTNWLFSLIGFLLTGVGLPVLGVIAVSKAGGTIDNLANKVSPGFVKILGSIVVLAIGPLLAIPRTGATVYEIGIQPMFGNIPPIVVSSIYFAITLFFVIKPSGIIDTIGKFLTPILLTVITAIILKGILVPMGAPIETSIASPFSKGFIDGYQTLDALVSIVLGGIVLATLRNKGYTEEKDQIRLTLKAGLLAGSGLAIVYGGLLYLGATASGVFTAEISKTELIIAITNSALGSLGQVGMCIVVSAACLTTSIGLTAIVGEFFEKQTNGKLTYKPIVIFTCVFSSVMAAVGVEKIVSLAVPLLVLVYPIAIVLILMNLADAFIPNKNAYKGAVIGAGFIGIFDALNAVGVNIEFATNIISKLPFASQGFAWVAPCLVLGIAFSMIPRTKTSEEVEVNMSKSA